VTKEEKAVIRAERALIAAVMGKPWGLLATWLRTPFQLERVDTIVRDLNAVNFACASLSRARLAKRRNP